MEFTVEACQYLSCLISYSGGVIDNKFQNGDFSISFLFNDQFRKCYILVVVLVVKEGRTQNIQITLLDFTIRYVRTEATYDSQTSYFLAISDF